MTRTILVCGAGRCGTSLMMQMLYRGGMPCVGNWPDFEDAHVGPDRSVDPAWMASKAGHAIKVLDPHRVELPAGDYGVIWMSREVWEQAKSQAKFMSMVWGMPMMTRSQLRAVAASIPRDKKAGWRRFAKADMLHVTFEHLVGPRPESAVHMIADFVGGGLDAAAMLGAIRRRDPRCAPGLDMELSLLAGAAA